MSRKADAVLTLALDLSETDRAEIARALFDSLVSRPDPTVEKAWRREVAKRIKALEAGEVEVVPWEVLRDELRARASEPRAR
jgi:putative addiction module component (TIGR02574 family)